MNNKRTLNIDVMVNGGSTCYCTLQYRYDPLFKVSPSDIEAFVFRKRPTLKYRHYVVLVIE